MNMMTRDNFNVDECGKPLVESSITVSVHLILPNSNYDSCLRDWERFQTLFDHHLCCDLVSMFSSLGFVFNADEDIDVSCSFTTSQIL